MLLREGRGHQQGAEGSLAKEGGVRKDQKLPVSSVGRPNDT